MIILLITEYTYSGGDLVVTGGMKQDWEKLGYILVRGLLGKEELGTLKVALEHDDGIMSKAYYVSLLLGHCIIQTELEFI